MAAELRDRYGVEVEVAAGPEGLRIAVPGAHLCISTGLADSRAVEVILGLCARGNPDGDAADAG
jgi:hypothetical protein